MFTLRLPLLHFYEFLSMSILAISGSLKLRCAIAVALLARRRNMSRFGGKLDIAFQADKCAFKFDGCHAPKKNDVCCKSCWGKLDPEQEEQYKKFMGDLLQKLLG